MDDRSALEAARRETLRTILALSLGLAVIVIAAKAVLLPFPVTTFGEWVRWTLRLGLVSAADLAFVAGLGLTLAATALLSVRTSAATTVWRLGLLAMYQVCGLYALASVPLFRLTMVPLTVELLSFSGGPLLMGSSIVEFATPLLLAAALAAGLALGLLPRWSRRLPGGNLSPRRTAAVLAGAFVVATAAASVSQGYIHAQWTDPNRWERRIAASPHATFLSSCWGELFKAERLTLSYAPDDVDDRDFTNPPRAAADGVSPVLFNPALPRPKNVILLVLESVGAQYLGLYGAAHDTTPCLAALVERGGLIVENVYAHAPSSPKGLVALTASAYPRVDWKLITRDAPGFDVPILPQQLAPRGVRSCYLHSGYWSWKNRDRFLRERGVDRLIDAENLPGAEVFSWGVSDRALFEAGLAWIDEDPTRPFHLFAWTIETHHPYVPGPNPRDFGVADEDLNKYLNAIRNADALIGWLHAELERRGLAESTLIAITGDHGEAFGQHGQRIHSFGIYEENVHVPLILLHPGLPRGGRRLGGVWQQIDIPATLLAATGGTPPADWQGRNLLAGQGGERGYFYTLGNEVLLGVREGNWKYHFNVASGQEELFDLALDPGELRNLAAAHAERCHAYRLRVGGLVRHQQRFHAAHQGD